jgi:hypothetical protein
MMGIWLKIAGEEARLWPYFAAISSHRAAWGACDLARDIVRRYAHCRNPRWRDDLNFDSLGRTTDV